MHVNMLCLHIRKSSTNRQAAAKLYKNLLCMYGTLLTRTTTQDLIQTFGTMKYKYCYNSYNLDLLNKASQLLS